LTAVFLSLVETQFPKFHVGVTKSLPPPQFRKTMR